MKCRRCRKEQKDEDWRGLKTCPICHEKDLGYSRLKSEQRKQTHANVKSIEKYKFEEPMPKELTNFGENQIHWRANETVLFADFIFNIANIWLFNKFGIIAEKHESRRIAL